MRTEKKSSYFCDSLTILFMRAYTKIIAKLIHELAMLWKIDR